MNKTLGKSILTLSLLTAAAASNADESFYAGVGVGHANLDGCDAVTLPCDDSSTVGKGVIGYNFHKNFGLEFSYNNLGKAYALNESNGFNASLDTDAFALSAVGRMDITENFGVYGKVGASSWESDLILRQDDARSDFEDDGTDLTYGAGLTWTFNRNYHLSVEWQRYQVEYDNFSSMFGDDSDADVFSVLYTISF